MGMLRTADDCRALLNADVAVLPVRDGVFDVVLAVHMLYHVPDRKAAVRELRRVLAPGGVCIAVTNGVRHTRSLRALVERAVRTAVPGWRMHPATHASPPRTQPPSWPWRLIPLPACARPANHRW
jgi:ubiquinone/menaquinone biosynthesis C-methylase UbiE